MLNHGLTAVIVTSTWFLIACDHGKPDAPLTSQSNPVTNTNAIVNGPSTAAAESVAKADNATKVARYADESALTPTTSRLVPTTTARSKPLGRQAVAVFDRGEDATLLARKGDYYLVIFSDPYDSSRQLAGWIYKDGLVTVNPPHGTPVPSSTLNCNTGEVHVLADGLCAKACTSDIDCLPVDGVCDGNGPAGMADHSVQRARYCVVAPQ